MSKLMIFCTCCDFRKDFYLMRAANWYHNLKQIKSLQELDPDYYIMHDGELTIDDIKKYQPSLLHESHLYIRNHKPMLGRTNDLSFPGWVRSFLHALEIGMEQYDYIVHIESDVLLLHPDKIVSYFTKPGMFCSHWFGRDIADSTCLVMNNKEDVKRIHDVMASRDGATNQLIEALITNIAKWQYVFNGGRLENDASHLTMDLDFIAQLYSSEAVNPFSKSIQDATANHVYYAITDEFYKPAERQYIPIQCMGTAKERFNCYHDDDVPDNISIKYNLYGKLTALYTAWKLDQSISDKQGIGFLSDDMWFVNNMVHIPNILNGVMCYDDLVPVKKEGDRRSFPMVNYDFQQYDIVLPRRQVQVASDGSLRTIIGTIIGEFGQNFYKVLEDIVREKHFDYGHKIWKDCYMDELIAQPVRPCFITKKYLFDKFCEFFFAVCKEMEEAMGDKILKEYRSIEILQPKPFERLLPYLMSLFCYRNRLVVKETNMYYFNKDGVIHAKPTFG